ncbi:hypothetical protein ACFWOJ_12015 [Streptomyces sp. NPDC058439]
MSKRAETATSSATSARKAMARPSAPVIAATAESASVRLPT